MRKSVVLAITLAAGLAGAHVAPSVDDNNRYIKLTPAGDRVRLAYTVFFGEVPGAGMRPSLDTNHDKTIDDAESTAFGAKLAKEVADAIVVDVDGHPQKIVWETTAVGMGTPVVAAGTFSVDLVAYVCLGPGPKHTVQLHDSFKLQRPGETEVRVEDAPNIAIDHARIGATDDPSHDYRFAGPAAQLTDDGLDLAFTAKPGAPTSGTCKIAAAEGGSSTRTAVMIALIVSMVGTLAAFVIRRIR